MTLRSGWVVLVALVVGSAGVAAAQAPTPPVGTAPPRYDASMPRDRQIELALSAAPPAVAAKAAVYILGRKGYEKVRDGSNGFSCMVDRELVTTMEPQCFDAEGSRTTLLVRLRVEELRAQGQSEAEITAAIRDGYRSKQFRAPSKPGIVYMLSNENWVFDPSRQTTIRFPGHLMFYAPYMTPRDLGYDTDETFPYLVHPGGPGALLIVVPTKR
jgi:hypothetical protein